MGEFSNYIKILEEFIDFFDNLISLIRLTNRTGEVRRCY